MLRSWAHRGGERELYQEGTLRVAAADRSSHRAVRARRRAAPSPAPRCSVARSPTVHEIAPADEFEMEMEDPVLERTLHHRYRITALPANA